MEPLRKKLLVFTIVYTTAFLALMGWRISVRSERGWIGMNYVPVLDSDRRGEDRWTVTEAYPGGPADRAGITSFSFRATAPSEPGPGGRSKGGSPFGELAARARVGDSMGIWPTDLTIENPLQTPGIVVDLMASLLAALTVLLAASLLCWRQPLDTGATLYYVTAALASGYSFLDGLRPLDSTFNLEDWGVWELDVAAGILWVSRGITWIALLAVFYKDKEHRLRLRMFVAGTLGAALLVALELTVLKPASSHQYLMEVYSKAPYWVFLMMVWFSIFRTPPEEQIATRPQPAAA